MPSPLDQENNSGRNLHDEEVVRLLTEHQNLLLSFIRGSVADISTAKDLLQEVNTTIWRKSAEFESGSNFKAWACRIARFRVLSSFRDRQRDILVYDDDYLETCSDEAVELSDQWVWEDRLEALEGCLEKLPEAQREMISKRYKSQESIGALADSLQRSKSAIKMTLLRARRALLECIEEKTKSPPQS